MRLLRVRIHDKKSLTLRRNKIGFGSKKFRTSIAETFVWSEIKNIRQECQTQGPRWPLRSYWYCYEGHTQQLIAHIKLTNNCLFNFYRDSTEVQNCCYCSQQTSRKIDPKNRTKAIDLRNRVAKNILICKNFCTGRRAVWSTQANHRHRRRRLFNIIYFVNFKDVFSLLQERSLMTSWLWVVGYSVIFAAFSSASVAVRTASLHSNLFQSSLSSIILRT